GNLDNNTALLKWTTSSELNSDYFSVERSVDGSSYAAIGIVTASGNSTASVGYSYADNDVTYLSSSLIYYRLKIVDKDGNYSYSNVVTISLADIAGRVTISPNPATEKIMVTIGALTEGQAQWKITDNTGRVVIQGSSQLKQGRNTVQLNMNKLSSGIYYLSVYGGGIDQKIKLQKL
ncbi:MAG TPA: T9SS type A sorting domain-containing protein, partial [Chitinophagaceae bacterium]|nr:T9SS type A sorting domain-containing protein [Chitinophagaceae bacterium]